MIYTSELIVYVLRQFMSSWYFQKANDYSNCSVVLTTI